MPTKATFNFIDHSREASKLQVYLPDIATDGSNYGAVLTDVTSRYELFKAALGVVTLCNFGTNTATPFQDISIPVTPVAEDAQREVKLWVQYADTVTGEYGEFNIPGPVDGLKQINTDEVDIAANAVAVPFIAVVNTNLVSRAGNPVQVTRMRYVRGAK